MNSGNRVTQKDISRKLNISQTTVANALNGNCNVSDELRKKIIREAKQMGYKPNLSAKALVKNGINLAFFASREPREYMKQVIFGLEDEVKKLSDYKVSLDYYSFQDSASDEEAKDSCLRMLQKSYDGIILALSFDYSEYEGLLKEYFEKNPKTKLVYFFDTVIEGIPYVCNVGTDSEAIGKIVAQLIHMQYGEDAKIGVITSSFKHGGHQIIVNSLKSECDRLKMTICDILENNDSKRMTYKCTGKLITEYPEINVIYVTSFDSVRVCDCLDNRGLGDKIKVIAHDVHDEMIPLMNDDKIMAVIYQNQETIGRTCVQEVFQAIMNDEKICHSISINPEIVLKANLYAYVKKLQADETL